MRRVFLFSICLLSALAPAPAAAKSFTPTAQVDASKHVISVLVPLSTKFYPKAGHGTVDLSLSPPLSGIRFTPKADYTITDYQFRCSVAFSGSPDAALSSTLVFSLKKLDGKMDAFSVPVAFAPVTQASAHSGGPATAPPVAIPLAAPPVQAATPATKPLSSSPQADMTKRFDSLQRHVYIGEVLLFALLLALAAGGFMIGMRLREKPESSNPPPGVPQVASPDLSQFDTRFAAIEKHLQNLSAVIASAPASEPEGAHVDIPVGTEADFRILQKGVEALAPPAGKTLSPGISATEERLLAAVNRWSAEGARVRTALTEYMNELGVNAAFHAHENLDRVFRDLTRFDYEFKPDKAGGWLLAQDGSDTVAVPIGASYFVAGKAPDLLDRLFDGMAGTPRDFTFEMVLRACRLRKGTKNGTFELLKKGTVQLAGKPAPPIARPRSFDKLLNDGKNSAVEVPEPTLLAILSQAFQTTALDIRTLSQRMDGLGQQVEDDRQTFDRRLEMYSSLASSGQQPDPNLHRLELELKLVQADLSTQLSNMRSTLSAGADSKMAARVSELETAIRTLKAGPPPRPAVRTEAPLRAAARAQTTSQPAPQAPLFAAQQAREVVPAVLSGWQQGAAAAISTPESASIWNQSQNADGYLARIDSLAAILRQLEGMQSENIEVVHLRVVENNEIEIHPTTPAAGHNRLCDICNSSQSFQLAVCVWEERGSRAAVFFPPGEIVPSDFIGGYMALIREVPSTPFHLGQVVRPAMLERKPGGRANAFRVKWQMEWKA